MYTRNTVGMGCNMPRCAKIHYCTRTRVTRFGNTMGLPAPVLNPIDDSMMLAIRDTLDECHEKLKDMMEHPKGGFEWLHTHNSPYELSKLALMNFPRSYRDANPGALSLDRPNPDGSVMTSLTHPVSLYKYLGVIFDPKLRWTLQQTKAVTSAAFWSSRI